MEYFNYNSTYFYECDFFNNTATSVIYTVSVHDALPIWEQTWKGVLAPLPSGSGNNGSGGGGGNGGLSTGVKARSEEHTSELQSHHDLVCRLLLEQKKKTNRQPVQHQNIKYQYTRTTERS